MKHAVVLTIPIRPSLVVQPPPPPPSPAALFVPAKAPVGAPQYIVPQVEPVQAPMPMSIIQPSIPINDAFVDQVVSYPGSNAVDGGTVLPNTTYAGLLSQPFYETAGAAGDVSQWSTFPQVSDLDSAAYSIFNASNVISAQFQTPNGADLDVPSWTGGQGYQAYALGDGLTAVEQFQVGLGGFSPPLFDIRSANATAPPANGIQLDASGNVQIFLEPTAPSYLATTGLVQLVDASGTHQLQAIAGDLFYDNELLAKANDIQNVADWSLYPALQATDLNQFALNNVESVELDTAGGVPVTLTSNAGGQVLANGVPLTTQADVSGAVSQWSTFFAVSSIDASGQTVVNASSVGIGAAGANGTLTTSGGGTNLLFNGAAISTGTGGDVSQWSTFAAVSALDISGQTVSNVESLEIDTAGGAPVTLSSNAGGQLLVNGSQVFTGVSGDVSQWATFLASTAVDMDFQDIIRTGNIMGKQISITGDNAADLTNKGIVNITGQNGLQGEVNIVANPGAFGQSVGGNVSITANGGVLGPVTFGGLVTIDANTGSPGSYGSATSAIKMSAAGINLYSGAIPSVGSLAGYTFISSTLGTNICSGLPPLLPNIPLTTYVYGTGGVGLEAGIGAEVEVKNSDFATLAIKPRTSVLVNFGDLAISGRSNIVQPNQYVTLDMVKSIAFDPATAASISNVATINGAAYPPPADLPTAWSAYPALQAVEYDTFGINNAGAIGCTSVTGTGSITGGTLTTTSGNVQIFDPAPPGTFYGDVRYDSGTGRLAVLPQGVGPEAVAYLSDIPTVLRPTNDIFVAPNGNDTTGNGSVTAPFATIGRAMTLANTIAQPTEVTIFLLSGTYTENITITRGNTYISSYSTGSLRQATNINGTITVGITTTSAFSVALAGLNILGNIIYNSDTTPDVNGNYSITDCFIIGVAGAATIAFTDTETSVHALTIENTRIQSGNTSDPGITATGGALNLFYSLITHGGTGAALQTATNNALAMRYSTIISSTTSTSPAPIVQFNNNAAVGHEIVFSQLRYSSTAVDVGGNKCCVQFNNSVGISAVFAQLYLSCVGASTGSPQIQCIQDTGAGAALLTYGDLQAVGAAHHISPTVTKTTMTQVP
jgi:hypothetical protein